MVRIFFIIAVVFAYDYNALMVEWKPTMCKLNNCIPGYLSTDFNIHGLWPNNWNGTYPQFCANETFSITPQTEALLNQYWLSYSGASQTFWEHEWSKHGTCVSPAVTCNTYFNTTVNLYITRNLLKTLSIFGIVPSSTKTYTTSQFAGSFSKTVLITCARVSNNYLLSTLQMCYDLNMNWISCKGTQGNCGTGFLIPLAS